MRRTTDKTPAYLARLASARTVAKETGIPYTSLRDLVFRGELPIIKIGRAWYFDRRDVEKFIRRSKERFQK